MSSNLIRRVCVSTTLALGLLSGGHASSAMLSWNYSFETPDFSTPEFGTLNTQLDTVGPTIEGTFSYDTGEGEAGFFGGEIFDIGVGPGSLSHTGNLDQVLNSSELFLETDSDNNPLFLGYWTFESYNFGIDFGLGASTAASETKFETSDFVNPVVAQVPEPGMLSLLGLGLAGLALTRRRKSAVNTVA